MDRKTEVMVSLGAAIGANCIPCFDFIYAKAKEVAMEDAEIEHVVNIAFKVKNGAAVFMKNAVCEVAGQQEESEAPCCVPEHDCATTKQSCC